MNSECGVKEVEIDNQNGEKGQMTNIKDGSTKKSSKRDDTENVDKENLLPNFYLPSELLVQIIDLVPKSQWASLEAVSHQFQDVVHGLWGKLNEIRLDEFAYNEEKKKADPCEIVQVILEKFLLLTPNVTSISGFDKFFDKSNPIRLQTIHLLSKFEHLETISFSSKWVVTADIFAVFLESSASRQSWKRLNIVDGIFNYINSNTSVGRKNRPALNLEYLKFDARYVHSFDRFLPIQWSGLKELVIAGSFVSAKEVLSIIRQCNQLAHLEIKVPECGDRNGQPSYTDFLQVVADLENLSILKIIGPISPWSWDSAFNDALLVLIQDLGRHRRITHLDMAKCFCGEELLGAIIDHLPHLKSLVFDFGHCTTKSRQRLANRMGQLECLKLNSRYEPMINGTIVRAICGNMSQLRCLHLDLLECNSQDLTSLADLRNLKELRITGTNIDNEIMETWTRLGFGSRLEALVLSLQDGISSSILGDFLKNIPRLRSMMLNGVTDDILEVISGSCPNLLNFYIYCRASITCTGIQWFIDHCSQLKKLQVVGNHEWFPSSLTVGKYRKIAFISDYEWKE